MGLPFPSLSMALNSIHLVYQVISFRNQNKAGQRCWGASLNGALFRALNSVATALLPSTEQHCPTRLCPSAEWIQWMELRLPNRPAVMQHTSRPHQPCLSPPSLSVLESRLLPPPSPASLFYTSLSSVRPARRCLIQMGGASCMSGRRKCC